MFVNTWSVEGFVSEGLQPAELGFGTHEKALPRERTSPRLRLGRRDLPGAARRRNQGPVLDADGAGAQHGFLVTHNEAISISDYFTARDGGKP